MRLTLGFLAMAEYQHWLDLERGICPNPTKKGFGGPPDFVVAAFSTTAEGEGEGEDRVRVECESWNFQYPARATWRRDLGPRMRCTIK